MPQDKLNLLFQYFTPSVFSHSKQCTPFTCLIHYPLFPPLFFGFFSSDCCFYLSIFWSSGFRFSHTLSCRTGRPQKCRTVESVRGSGIPHAEGKHWPGQEGTQRSKQYTYPPQHYHTPTSTIIFLPLTLPILEPSTATFHCLIFFFLIT